MPAYREWDRLEVVAPNFKRRLSGVTSTIIQLIPEQVRQGTAIATLGPGLPDHLPKLRAVDAWRLWTRPANGKRRIWHARRNIEMIVGVVMRDVLRMPLRLVFTSAAQRNHKALTKWLIRRMDHVIATSRKSGAFLDVRHSVIMHGIDTERFVPPADKASAKTQLGLDPSRKIAGCTGRIRHSKGTDLFVDAMIALLPGHPDWDAVITGRATAQNTGFKSDLEDRIRAAGLEERIRFVGEVDDLAAWYQAFDLFAAPSRQEGFGLTPLEAMACGVPCVTSDAGSYADMMPKDDKRFAVPAGDGQRLTEAMAGAMAGAAWPDMRAHVTSHFALANEARALGEVYAGLWEARR